MPTQADNMLVRVQSEKVLDDQPQQMVQAQGRYNERYGGTKGVPRIQSYGFSSHPPAGSQGVTTTLGGNPDNAMVVGMEHPEHRPKDLGEGEFKQYEKWGGYQHAKEDKWVTKVGSATIEHERGSGIVHINRPGAE